MVFFYCMTTPRLHIADMTKEAIQTHGWEVLPHPPYSPDLAPTDFHLFRSLSNAMHGISFNNDAELKAWLMNFSSQNPVISAEEALKTLLNVGKEVTGSKQQRGIDN